jgi:hypothetical protein
MAFTVSELSLMAYTGANGGHHQLAYANTAEDDVAAAGFFNDASGILKVGDRIYDIDGGVEYRVASNAEGVVAVAALYDSPA